MFDYCNNFFKGTADGRMDRPPRIPATRGGIGAALLPSAGFGVRAQYLHRQGVVLSCDSHPIVPSFARHAGHQGLTGCPFTRA
jgi:hypothetical protein